MKSFLLFFAASLASSACFASAPLDTPEQQPQSIEDAPTQPARAYTVQFSSFETKGRADRLIEKLKTHGLEAFESKMNFRGKEFYRVCVGSFATPKAAHAHLKEFAAKGQHKYVLVQSVRTNPVIALKGRRDSFE